MCRANFRCHSATNYWSAAFTPLQLPISKCRTKINSIGLPTLKRAEAHAPIYDLKNLYFIRVHPTFAACYGAASRG
jgi:hypothetical protein